MSYISNCLTHWVGKDRDERAQYTLLTNEILARKRLLYNPCRWDFRSKYGGIETDSEFKVPMICFTDIPFSEVAKHCDRYSRFGVSFDKVYLANCLASPVFYCLNPLVYTAYSFLYHRIKGMEPVIEGQKIPRGQHEDQVWHTSEALTLLQHVFSFMKDYSEEHFHFAENEPEPKPGQEEFFEDPGAYYFEREWRMVLFQQTRGYCWSFREADQWFFRFSEKYLKYVILPRKFAERFKKEWVDLLDDYGQLPTVLGYEDLAYV